MWIEYTEPQHVSFVSSTRDTSQIPYLCAAIHRDTPPIIAQQVSLLFPGATSIEKYDLRTNGWTQVANMNGRRLQFGVAVIDDKLYVTRPPYYRSRSRHNVLNIFATFLAVKVKFLKPGSQ